MLCLVAAYVCDASDNSKMHARSFRISRWLGYSGFLWYNKWITRTSAAAHGDAASLRKGRRVPQRGCTWSGSASLPFHPKSQTRTLYERYVCRDLHHQIWPMRGPSTVHTRCALAQTIVCHEPLRFSENFYVATYFSFGLEHDTGGLYLDILTTCQWVPTNSWM